MRLSFLFYVKELKMRKLCMLILKKVNLEDVIVVFYCLLGLLKRNWDLIDIGFYRFSG